MSGKVNRLQTSNRSEGEAEQAVESDGVDAKPSDLHMARVKSR